MLFSPKVIAALALAAVLAGTHWTAYRTGRALVAGEWAAERAEQANAAVLAEQAARAREQELSVKVNDVTRKVRNEQKLRAADAQLATDELQLLQAALASAAARDSSATARADGASASKLLGACAAEHQRMAAEADTIAVTLTGLQSFVSQVCKP